MGGVYISCWGRFGGISSVGVLGRSGAGKVDWAGVGKQYGIYSGLFPVVGTEG